MTTQALTRDVLRLPTKKRAAIAARLLESLETPASTVHATKWGREAEARMDAYDAGKLRSIDAAEVLAYSGKTKK